MRTITAGLLGPLAALAALAGCVGGPGAAPARVSTRAGQVNVTLVVNEPTAGVQEAEVILTDAAGSAVQDAAVTASGTMAQMGHAGQVTTGQPIGPGRYRLSGDLFPMSGRWSLRVRVRQPGNTSVATLPVVIFSS
jgi:hypothetical protein